MPFYLATHEEFLRWHLVPSRGAVWGTRSSMLDWHVLKGFGIYMIGILGSLSDVVLHVVHSSCNLLVNITRVLSQPSFSFGL